MGRTRVLDFVVVEGFDKTMRRFLKAAGGFV